MERVNLVLVGGLPRVKQQKVESQLVVERISDSILRVQGLGCFDTDVQEELMDCSSEMRNRKL